ncbi:hypothetical protein, partial [Actinoplanes sp. NBRC 101535]|uniref:hypothetical protein n=1 Tax=Actinoplanes sp. NBRC 101535 TaxID=3032196 RepID=UPI00255435A9
TGRVTTLTRDLNRQTQRFTEANRDLTRQTQRVTELDQELNRQTQRFTEAARTAEVNRQLAEQQLKAERTARTAAEAAAQQTRTDAGETIERFTQLLQDERVRSADLADENADLREALVQGNVRPIRPGRGGSAGSPTPTRPVNQDDGSALAQMFATRPDPTHWTAREAKRVTRAGLSGRAQRLAEAANQHIADCTEPTHAGCFTSQPTHEARTA